MVENSLDFINGTQRPSGSKARAENYLGAFARPYALKVIDATMGSKKEDADNLYDAVHGIVPKDFGKARKSGTSAVKTATPTPNTLSPLLTQKIASNNLAKV